MKLALAQINPTVGDLAGNRERVLTRYREAALAGADLVAFPEMCVPGYPPRDLLEHPSFVAAQERTLREIAGKIGAAAAVVGFAEPNPDPKGRPCFNAAAFLSEGKVAAVYHKRLLPVYDVFDEDRYFEPGRAPPKIVQWKGLRIALTVCEDMWAEVPVAGRRIYHEDPVAQAAASGADLVLNIAASPFACGKIERRLELARAHALRHHTAVAVVNQVGGNDELVFDGTSALFDGAGRLQALAASFREDLVFGGLPAGLPGRPLPAASEAAQVCDALTMGLSDYARKCGFARACLGLSGGIDSAVTAAIAAGALGGANVLGVAMPSRFTSQRSMDDAKSLADRLGIRYQVLPIEPVFQAFLETLATSFEGRADVTPDVTEENLQARIRGTLLMALSNKHGSLVLSTGNKSEMSVGYSTLYGDLCGGLALISDVPKTLVYRLAEHLNRDRCVIPASTIERAPTAELRFDQKDSDALPPYEVLDPILKAYVEERLDPAAIAAQGFDAAVVREVARKVHAAEYKRRQAPPGIKVTSKAFGAGRRMPIASRWGGVPGFHRPV